MKKSKGARRLLFQALGYLVGQAHPYEWLAAPRLNSVFGFLIAYPNA